MIYPPEAQIYFEALAGRKGVIGIWIARGEACLLGHAVCTTYFLVVDREHAADVMAAMHRVYLTSKAVRDAPMCWTAMMLTDGSEAPIALLAEMAGAKSDTSAWEKVSL